MTVQISLSAEIETRLRERAAEAGLSPDELVRRIVESQLHRPTLEELSGPIHRRFVECGSSEEELVEELDRAKHEMRADRRQAFPSLGNEYVRMGRVSEYPARIPAAGIALPLTKKLLPHEPDKFPVHALDIG